MVKQFDIGQFITARPWSAMGGTTSPSIRSRSVAFFVPLDLSFSCWFFFLARKDVSVSGVAGLDGPGSQAFRFSSSRPVVRGWPGD